MPGYKPLMEFELFHQNKAFAIWREPTDKNVNVIVTHAENVKQYYSFADLNNCEGFVFVPFEVNNETPIYHFHEETETKANITSQEFGYEEIKWHKSSTSEITRQKYIEQITHILALLKKCEIEKAVLTRMLWNDTFNFNDIPVLFNRLIETYPNAFVYQIFIPGKGYWAGASPELLLETKGSKGYTVSLAATQPANGKESSIKWNTKEIHEQELVSKHIRTVLNELGLKEFRETAPETYNVGKMVHLRSVFEFNRNNLTNKTGDFLKQLHPTPAVCGLPVETARLILNKVEEYPREYYTGFLGRISANGNTCLYVNLRCLQAFQNGIGFYAGGGITIDSIPENEWDESQLKIQTLLQIIEKAR